MKKRVFTHDQVLESLRTMISPKTAKLLEAKALDRGMPISRLIAIAIDNELDAPTPFNYNIDMPNVPFQEFQYTDEAGKVMRFLEQFGPSGTDVTTLVLCRRDIGVEDREKILLAIRELLHVKLIEEFKPKRTVFHYSRNPQRLRVINAVKTKRGIA